MSATKSLAGVASAKKASADLLSGIEAVRARIEAIHNQAADVSRQPVDLETASGRVDQWLAGLRDRVLSSAALTSFTATSFTGGPVLTDREAAEFSAAGAAIGLRALFMDALAEVYRDRPGCAEHERKAQLDRLAQEALDLELAEESMIRAAEIAGLEILRRADADPRAVLAPTDQLP